MNMTVSEFGRDPFSDLTEIRRRKKEERKKKEKTQVKYKPFGIAMPGVRVVLVSVSPDGRSL